MRVAIVTAEPLGAYHLAPFRSLLTDPAHSFHHLIPYDESTQGLGFNTVTHLDFLHTCDKLVITGGSFSPWTEAVGFYANSISLPVVYSELAFVPRTQNPSKVSPVVTDFTAMGELSRSFLQSYLNTESQGVLSGAPLSQSLPNVPKVPNRVVLFSTDDPVTIDPGLTIVTAGKILQSLGFEVIVCLHPRGVDHDLWEGFSTMKGSNLEVVASASLGFGFIGSVTPLTVNVDTPFIGFDPLGSRLGDLPDFFDLLSGYCLSVDDLLESINPIPSPKILEANLHIAPIRNAVDVIRKIWVS